MRNFLVNACIALLSVTFCLAVAEGATRLIDGQAVFSFGLPSVIGSPGNDTTAKHLDEVPLAPGISRDWFALDPAPLPNRKAPPAELTELYQKLQLPAAHCGGGISGEIFWPWDMFKAWNAAFVGNPCQHPYFRNAPGRLFVFDPLDGMSRPLFRFLPNTTSPDGLVTNEFGWRGRPVSFARKPRTIRIVFVGASTTAEIHHYPFSGPEYIENWLNHWAEARQLDIRFEVLNAARESVNSRDIAPIVEQEVAPTRPDLVVYYEGGNQLDLRPMLKTKIPDDIEPRPAGLAAQWLREASACSALARRAESLTSGKEWPKPSYELRWPKGLDEFDPDITRFDLPVYLTVVLRSLDFIRDDLRLVGSELALASFHWLVKDGLELDASRNKAILDTLNVNYFPYTYRDLQRMTDFENRVFAKYARVNNLPFIDVARYMPKDPALFSDAFHNTPAGVRLRAWIVLQQLVPLIEARLASGAWPRAVPEMPDKHPAFGQPIRVITFDCRQAAPDARDPADARD